MNFVADRSETCISGPKIIYRQVYSIYFSLLTRSLICSFSYRLRRKLDQRQSCIHVSNQKFEKLRFQSLFKQTIFIDI